MTDRLLNGALRVTIVSLTAAVVASAIALCYWGLFQVLAARLTLGGANLLGGVALAFAGWTLVRNRNDLVDC